MNSSFLRIAVISTPRSGNTWLRYMLARIYDAEQLAVHTPAEVPWLSLPDKNFILQLHWHCTAEFTENLRRHGFKVIALRRHPLDVLLSILQFSRKEAETGRWLNGECGDEKSIHLCMPTSPEFLEYSTGPRARALLGVSVEWRDYPGAIPVRYEDLVSDKEKALRDLISNFGPPRTDIPEVIDKTTLNALRPTSTNSHFWQGNPGHWRHLIPSEIALAIFHAQQDVFESLGYECLPDNLLKKTDVNLRWMMLMDDTMGSAESEIVFEEQQIRNLIGEIKAAKQNVDELNRYKGFLEAELASERQKGEALAAELNSSKEKNITMNSHVEDLKKELNAAKGEIDRLGQSSDYWQTSAGQACRELQSVYASKSWRITRPLRIIMTAVILQLVFLKGTMPRFKQKKIN